MSEPIEQQYRDTLDKLAGVLDMHLNDPDKAPTIGFALFLFEFGKEGRINYISNGERKDMIKAVGEWLENAKKEGV